ncbi:MAG: response regulator [Nitrospinae bacterium]|nr:response regulator [Nitrospinota bacterium]
MIHKIEIVLDGAGEDVEKLVNAVKTLCSITRGIKIEFVDSHSEIDYVFLLIDDDATYRKLLSAYLKSGFPDCLILEAENADRGLEIMRENKYPIDLLFLDYMMPNVDGLALLKIMDMNMIEIPTIMITAYTDEVEKRRGQFKIDYLNKEVSKEDILSMTRKYLEKKEKQKNL